MSNIQVVVRMRPLRSGESQASMEVLPDSRRILFGPKAFDCDHLVPQGITQEDFFETCCKGVVDSVIDGSRGTILVYGQTGTGKTHTIFGPPSGAPDGVVFQSVHRVLDSLRGNAATLCLSVLEVYMEKVTDLIGRKEVPVHCGVARNLSWSPVASVTEAADVVFGALKSRHVACTNMNERSSRSHVMVNLKILRRIGDGEDALTESAQLSLVDLAGSECVGKSKAVGKTMQEASYINKSLLALKQIILALSSATAPSHVPYRDSKLTELLQDSIGGCSKTLMVACLSPAARDLEETKSTLEYATKARQIKNLAQTDRERMQIKIKGLEFEIQKMKNKFDQQTNERGCVVLSRPEYDELIAAQTKNEEMMAELQSQYEKQEQAQNYVLYHNGVEKALREDLANSEKKLEEALAQRNLISKNVSTALSQMRMELQEEASRLTTHLQSYVGDLFHDIQSSRPSIESIDNVKSVVQEGAKYMNEQIQKFVEKTATDIAKITEQTQTSLEQLKRREELTAECEGYVKSLQRVLTKLREVDDCVRINLQDTHANLELTHHSLSHQTLVTSPDSISPVVTAVEGLADEYRTRVSTLSLREIPDNLTRARFDTILNHAEAKVMTATLVEKRKGEDTGVVPEASDRSASTQDPKRRKKSILGNSTNVVA